MSKTSWSQNDAAKDYAAYVDSKKQKPVNGRMWCSDCMSRGVLKLIEDDEYLTMINPPGGYGREEILVCDDCMKSGRWDHWIEEHWPNWPEPY